MAIQWMDGFDHYGSGTTVGPNNMLAGSWANVSQITVDAPSWGARTGDYAISSITGEARRILPTPTNELFISMGFAVNSLPSEDLETHLVQLNDGSNINCFQVYCNNTGNIVLTNNLDVILGTTSGPVIVSNNWHFIEMFYDGTAGTFTLRVDDASGTETAALTVTGLANHTIGSLIFGPGQQGAFGGTTAWYDDILVHDTDGGTNDGWLGDRRIATLFANEDTPTDGWTPSYYKMFGDGILRLAHIVSGQPAIQGPNSYISASGSTQLDIDNNDFTLETMIRFDRLPTSTDYSTIFSRWDANMNRRSFRLTYGSTGFNNNCLQFDTSTDGTSGTVSTPILYPWTPDTNTWYHLALCRAAGELLLFVDGVQLGVPIADADTYFGGGAERLTIGMEQTGGGNAVISTSKLIGRMDETRFTNGTGRYTSTFTPPTQAFPRSGVDPYWTEVVLLMGYEGTIADESSFARTISTFDSAASITPSDGPDVGAYSTVNKEAPDDNTFISASYEYASNIFTMTTVPANADTVTVGTKNGSTPAVYTFKTTMTTAFDVQIVPGDAQATLENLVNAINTGPGSGTAYFAGTTINFDVIAELLPTGQFSVEAIIAGTSGNSIASTKTGTAASWVTTTLTGGANIPGPTTFKLQRPPRNTTVISGMQMVVRALKTDAGLATIQSTFIGGLGGEADGAAHNLTTSVSYYTDVIEEDPDTSGPITPTTIINGEFQVNRTA